MPAYNIAADQRLGKPVSAYYKGKALRAGIQSEEAKARLYEEQLADLPDQRAMRRQEALRQQERDQRDRERHDIELADARRRGEEHLLQIGETHRARLRDAVTAAKHADASGQDPQAAFRMSLAAGAVSELERQEIAELEYRPEEMDAILAVWDKGTTGRFQFKDGVVFDSQTGEFQNVEGSTDSNLSAGERKASRILEVMRDEDLSDSERDAMVKALGGYVDQGGVKITDELAGTIATEMIDESGVGENWLGQNSDLAESLLTVELMRRFQSGEDIATAKTGALNAVKKMLGKAGISVDRPLDERARTSGYELEQLEAETQNPQSALYGMSLEEAVIYAEQHGG